MAYNKNQTQIIDMLIKAGCSVPTDEDNLDRHIKELTEKLNQSRINHHSADNEGNNPIISESPGLFTAHSRSRSRSEDIDNKEEPPVKKIKGSSLKRQ